MSCPCCGEAARFERYQERSVQTLLGEVRYGRAYYRCRHCRREWCVGDESLRVVQGRSPGAREVITLAGTLEPFEEGARRVLGRMVGLRLAAATVRRVTEGVGDALAARRASGETFGPRRAWRWHVDARGQSVAYLSLDATGVQQQGPRREKVEGRMANVGAVFNPPAPGSGRAGERVWDRRYVAGLLPLPELARQLRRECQAVGVSQAAWTLVLTDGGAGLQECAVNALAGVARRIVFILDFYHAAEHLRELAKVLWPHDEPARRVHCQAWCHTLKSRGGAALLAELERLDLDGESPAVRAAHQNLLGYLRSNRHRTDYPTYLARGWQIGSGMIESACKTVVGGRLKQSGMRWRPVGTTALCQLRALFKSQPEAWRDYWNTAA